MTVRDTCAGRRRTRQHPNLVWTILALASSPCPHLERELQGHRPLNGSTVFLQVPTLDVGVLPHPSGVMATGADVRDILELGGPEGDAASGTISKKDIINPDKVAGAFERAEVWVKVLAKGWEGVLPEERWWK